MAKLGQNEFEYIQRKKRGKKNYEMNFNNLFFVLQFLEFLFQLSQII